MDKPLTTAVLIHQLPDVLAEKAIEILEANQVLLRSSVRTTKSSIMGMELYLDSELSLERAVFHGAVTIFTTSYRIYPLVTDLTVHGAQAHMRREELKMHMMRLGTVLFVYEEKGTDNYRVIIHYPEIPEKVQAWPQSSDVIFKDGFKYPITFFCRFCRSHGHLRCQCDRGKGKLAGVKPKLCLQLSPKFLNPHEHFTPSPSSSSCEFNKYCFQPNKTLSRNSKDTNLLRTISKKEPTPRTRCDSGGPSDNKKLSTKVHGQKYCMLKEVEPVINRSSVKRKLDSPIDVNGAKRKMVQQIKDQKLKSLHSDFCLPSNTLESVIARDFAFPLKKENESSDEDLKQMKGVKYAGKEETTFWVPMEDPILRGSRKVLDSARVSTQTGNMGSRVEEKNNDAKLLGNLKLNHPKDLTSIPKSSSKTNILPNSHPNCSSSLLKRNSSPEDFITKEELNDIINNAKKNRITQEMTLKYSKEESIDQLSEQESTTEKIYRENVRFSKSVNFKYVKKQSGKMVNLKSNPKFLRTKEKDLYPEKSSEEPSINDPVIQEKTVNDANSSSKGAGISGIREATRVRQKSRNPITSEIMNKIIENSSGELSPSALKAFFVQVVKRKKPIDLARNYSNNVHLIILQLKSIVTNYYNGQDRGSKAEGEIRWIKSLIVRMESETPSFQLNNTTSQANRSIITFPINEELKVRVKKEIQDY